MFFSFFICWPQRFGRDCQPPRLSFLNASFLDEQFAHRVDQGGAHYFYLDKAAKKPGPEYFYISEITKQVFVVAVIVRNCAVDNDESASVTVSVTIHDSQGIVDVKTSHEYTSRTAWERAPFKIPPYIGASAFKAQMRQNGFPLSDTDPDDQSAGRRRASAVPARIRELSERRFLGDAD
jgi:hypothetical protein